jgi:hypothetical protein
MFKPKQRGVVSLAHSSLGGSHRPAAALGRLGFSAPSPRWSREFVLVAALCRWPSPSIATDDARAASIDWSVVLATARRHRVEGLVHAGLKAATIRPPALVADALARASTTIARDNLAQAGESLRLATLLTARGIAPLFLKGATLAMLAYGTLALKHSRDIDILVSRERALDAIAILRQSGYDFVRADLHDPVRLEIAIEVLYEVELRHARSGLMVELHWRLFDVDALLPALHGDSAVRMAPIGSFALPTFGDADLFAYLCVHCARHGWSRLKWLADVHALIARRDGQAIERLHDEARARGAGRCVAVTLLLCQDLFDLRLDAGFSRRLRSDRMARWLLVLARDILGHETFLDDRPVAKIRLEAAQMLLGIGWRHVGAVIGRQWSGTNERLAFPLPRPLFFLYGFARPPLWIARRIRSIMPGIRGRKSSW